MGNKGDSLGESSAFPIDFPFILQRFNGLSLGRYLACYAILLGSFSWAKVAFASEMAWALSFACVEVAHNLWCH